MIAGMTKKPHQSPIAMLARRGLSRVALLSTLLFLQIAVFSSGAEAETTWTLETPRIALSNIDFSVTAKSSTHVPDAKPQLIIGGQAFSPDFSVDGVTYSFTSLSTAKSASAILVVDGKEVATTSLTVLPAWLSLLPVILAIAMALIVRQVIPAIFVGVWAGASLAYGLGLTALLYGLLDTVAVYVLAALADEDRMSIVLFTLMIGGLVGIVNKNGGMDGIVHVMKGLASTRQRGQLATSMLGTAIFFDDYANTMVVGNAMRPITDKLKISREKLAYLVDSTAAPVASIFLITTWIGFQVGLIDNSVRSIDGITESAYSIFLSSVPYGFYSVFAIVFVYLVAATGRDFGPMHVAEVQAMQKKKEDPKKEEREAPIPGLAKEIKPQAVNALLPLAVLIFGALIGIYVTGKSGLDDDATLRDIIGNGNSYKAMIWSSFLAVLVATFLSWFNQSLKISFILDAWLDGIKAMFFAIIVLTLAWSLAGVNETLHTADFLASALSGHLSAPFLPAIVFLLAAAMAFATGSSWGVMGIMIPLVIPLAWTILTSVPGVEPNMGIFYACVASLLSGAVWGDHSSPISDTTILSSMASDCDHLAHVQTQLPYAFVVALVAIVIGLVPAGFGISPLVSLPLGVLALYAILRVLGKKSTLEDQSKS